MTMADSKDWIVRYYANHDDIPEGQSDGHIVRELIRCKDCKYQEISTFFGRKLYGCELAEGYSHVCLDDDFCSRAERKTE